MRKMLSVIIVFALGFNFIIANNIKKSKTELSAPKTFPTNIENNSRTEAWILLMEDKYYCAWCNIVEHHTTFQIGLFSL